MLLFTWFSSYYNQYFHILSYGVQVFQWRISQVKVSQPSTIFNPSYFVKSLYFSNLWVSKFKDNWFKWNGIFTCPYTSQKNGIAERKNIYLVEIACTFLPGANVPTHHLVDAILLACYLTSSSLNNKVPYSILFLYEHLFHTPPQVFSCVCFAHVSSGLDNFSAWATKCVFLKYSRLRKGYQCYSPNT